jgi:hypothetical protein
MTSGPPRPESSNTSARAVVALPADGPVMSASSSAFRLTPSVPNRNVSAPPVPFTETMSRWELVSPNAPRSISSSISDAPVPSTAAPGASGPLLRSMRAAWPPGAPVTVILSVFVTVAAPQGEPPTRMLPATERESRAASPGALTVTAAVPAAKLQPTAAPAVEGPARSCAANIAATSTGRRRTRLLDLVTSQSYRFVAFLAIPGRKSPG